MSNAPSAARPTPPDVRSWSRLPWWLWGPGAATALIAQLLLGLQGIANYWQWGHNGFNGGAYLLAARNTLRWDILFPAQYASGSHVPGPEELYTHAPLGLHLHNVASVWAFGDTEVSIRIVPAVFGLLAAAMLFALVKRFYGDLHAVVATWVYVLLPINTAFANMTNHDTGCIFWSLVMLYCYLSWIEQTPDVEGRAPPARSWWWVAGVALGCVMAVNWNWPAYYYCLLMAVHWLYVSFDAPHRRLRHVLGVNREHLLLGLFCVLVLANFAGFFWLVETFVGSFSEMSQSFTLRSSTPPGAYKRIWDETWSPMFSTAALAVSGAWVVGLVIRHARGDARAWDLVPLCFGFAGVAHTVLFKQTALVHIYWPWQLNPFVAIACASALLWGSRVLERGAQVVWVRARGELPPGWARRLIAAACLLLILEPFGAAYLTHVVPKIPEGRRLAGTFNYPGYKTEYLKVLFARKVHGWTELDTGVLLLRNVPHRVEFVATVDRVRGWTSRVDRLRPPKLEEVTGGWVAVGDARKTPRRQMVAAAARHPFYQYGVYFMVDHRRDGQDIKIWNLLPREDPSLWWRFFVNAYEPPMDPVRDHGAEERMRREVADLKARKKR